MRDTRPRRQLAEVLERFDLWRSVDPFSRCSICNSLVLPVPGEEVQEELLPGTRRHYQDFWRCGRCGRIYWKGAHYRSLCGLVDRRSLLHRGESPAGEKGHADEGHHPMAATPAEVAPSEVAALARERAAPTPCDTRCTAPNRPKASAW